jgi:DNA-binding NarL/FixJ family response regulator
MVRILIADDHDTLRRGLRDLLAQHEGWEVCAEASNGREAVELTRKLLPRVVVLDLAMPQMNGFEAIPQIKGAVPNCEVLVFTVHDTEEYVLSALRAGALGYLLKADAAMHITAAVEALCEHKPYFTSSVSKAMLDVYVARARAVADAVPWGAPSLNLLGIREREVIQLLAEGRGNKSASALLGISLKTVEKHRAAMMKKLGARSVAELVRFAVRQRVIEP